MDDRAADLFKPSMTQVLAGDKVDTDFLPFFM